MKHIDRYAAAYVIECLFGTEPDIHSQYIHEILRESTSVSRHPILSKVLDYVRQGDPEDPRVKDEVAAYVTAMIQAPKSNPAPDVGTTVKYYRQEGFAFFKFYNGVKLIGYAIATEDRIPEAIKQIQETFPGAVIQEI